MEASTMVDPREEARTCSVRAPEMASGVKNMHLGLTTQLPVV